MVNFYKNLNKLRRLVYPDENIGAVTYPGDKSYSQLYFTPNLVYLTINGLYEHLLGLVDSLSFSIEDNVSWANTTDVVYKSLGNTDTKPYPTVINVSVGMKIIEHPSIKSDKGQYTYLFDSSTEGKQANRYVNYFTDNTAMVTQNDVALLSAGFRGI